MGGMCIRLPNSGNALYNSKCVAISENGFHLSPQQYFQYSSHTIHTKASYTLIVVSLKIRCVYGKSRFFQQEEGETLLSLTVTVHQP